MINDAFKEVFRSIYNYIKKIYKYVLVILLYFLYQTGFIYLLINKYLFNMNKIPRGNRILIFVLNDLIYVLILLFMFRKEIKKGFNSLKNNFINNANLALTCWVIGNIIMITSSMIISKITHKNLSGNEEIIRQSIKLAPIYMLLSCSIVAPIFEEMVFRKSIKGFINNKYIYIFLSGFLFGLLHVIGNTPTLLDLLYIIPYGSMGCALAYLYYKSDIIILPILVHMIHNTILVLVQMLGGLLW